LRISEDVYLVGSGEIRLSNPLDCHVYLLESDNELAVIDAGSGVDTDQILSNISRDCLEPQKIKYLFLTHCHADHACGASEIRTKTHCEVVASIQETKYIERGSDAELGLDVCKKANWYPLDFRYKHCKVDMTVSDGEVLTLGKSRINCVVLPGHSYGVLCLLFESGDGKLFFSSDSVFIGGTIGLGNWPGSSLQSYRENISKLQNLMVDELYPGHMLWTLKEGQKHLLRAIENLSYGWIPPIGGHNHPVY